MTETAAPINEASPESRRKSAALLIAATVVIALAAGGSAWWYLHRDLGRAPADAELVDVIVDAPPGVRSRTLFGRRPPNVRNAMQALGRRVAASVADGVVPTGTGFVVRAGNTHVDVTPVGTAGKWQYRYSFYNVQLATAADQETLNAMAHAREAGVASKAGVTADQLEQLRKLPPGGAVIEPAQREAFAQAFLAWLAASGRPTNSATSQPANTPNPPAAQTAEKTLVASLADIGQKQLAPSKKNAADRATAIRAILGDATLAKLK